ncbi:zf-HC2 domain-containing protein [Streptomyces zaomyceticus]|uniref:zf-HC2 domain-containing protein n=1 Tax=Streptomyces zaomyceticus TaxID=68286 RepID=UPI002E220553
MKREDLHILSGAHVLDSLDDTEREALEGHLAGCEACARDVREFRETAARLAGAVSAAVPERLESEVMGRIEQVRQLPPLVSVGPEVSAFGRSSRRLVWMLAASIASAALLGGAAIVQYQAAAAAEREVARLQETADSVAAVPWPHSMRP